MDLWTVRGVGRAGLGKGGGCWWGGSCTDFLCVDKILPNDLTLDQLHKLRQRNIHIASLLLQTLWHMYETREGSFSGLTHRESGY